jgi:nickel/cobalt exporter
MELVTPAYLGVIAIGLLHGAEPGHGWPVAVVYSMKKGNITSSALLSASVIGFAHLVSSIAVVVAYVLLQTWLDFDAPWIKYAAAGLLLILAFRMFREKTDSVEDQHGHMHENRKEIEHEHEHEHPGQGMHIHKHKHAKGVALSLLGLASFAFILGFAHEEEFALLAMVAGGVNAWVLMISYGIAVLAGLIIVTVACVRLYHYLQPRLIKYEKYIPKIGAGILVVMAIILLVSG